MNAGRQFPSATRAAATPPAVVFAALGVLLGACSSDAAGPSLARPPNVLPDGASAPGIRVSIGTVAGSNGDGTIEIGEPITVRFTLRLDDGRLLALDALDGGSLLLSGPTFNYHRVLPEATDVVERARRNGDGSYSYTFAQRLPATYLAPFHDTDAFTRNELTGQPLLDGTYTVGLALYKDYLDARDETIRDAGDATFDFRVGSALQVEPRAVVSTAHCNRCHGGLSAHGQSMSVERCVLCHTTGAEDANDPATAGGTPATSIDFKVMIHKIHTGRDLPSVLGVSTKPDGSRDYAATPRPYRLAESSGTVHDYSGVGYPAWPSAAAPLPRDVGHAALGDVERAKEDAMRSGAGAACADCHGDPDGAGPIETPANGDLIYAQPSIDACASCHDDWNPKRLYVANTQPMPAQADDSFCIRCHGVSGNPLDVVDAHRHPLVDPRFAPGLHFAIEAVGEASGASDGDGVLEVGEAVDVEFTVTDDGGNAVALTSLSRFEIAITGRAENPNLLYLAQPDVGAFGAGPRYAGRLPERVSIENLGPSVPTPPASDSFTTARAPHRDTTADPTELLLTTATATTSALAADATATQNYVDLAVGGGAGFARDDLILLGASPANGSVARVQLVDGDRLWLDPRLHVSYTTGTTAAKLAAPTAIPRSSWSLDIATGTIEEDVEFGAGLVLARYTTDFTVPATYPGTLNDSPDLGPSGGDWRGLPILSGTYTIGIWASRAFSVSVLGEPTGYREAATSDPVAFSILSGDPPLSLPRIETDDSCRRCHNRVVAHGSGREGYANCLLCHGIAGAEDRARFVAANAPATPGTTIDFRAMLHKVHHGQRLENASSYEVIGFGAAAYPNNFTTHRFDDVRFPHASGGTSSCGTCHGANIAWIAPAERTHPAAMTATAPWTTACLSCHDNALASAHAAANTAPDGRESCALCHGPDGDAAVEAEHFGRR